MNRGQNLEPGILIFDGYLFCQGKTMSEWTAFHSKSPAEAGLFSYHSVIPSSPQKVTLGTTAQLQACPHDCSLSLPTFCGYVGSNLPQKNRVFLSHLYIPAVSKLRTAGYFIGQAGCPL